MVKKSADHIPFAAAPLDNELRIGIKKAYEGLFSTFANTKIKKGDVLEVMPPSGKFYTELNLIK